LRNDFLKLAICEHVGHVRARNVENFLPVQIQHRQPAEDVPDSLLQYFPDLLQENAEADYMIVVKKKNQKFITEQLRQLRLLKHTRYYYIKQTLKVHPTLMAQIMNRDFSTKEEDVALVSIKVPPRWIDREASAQNILAALTNVESQLVVKMPFDNKNKGDFNMFDSRERLETIEAILSKQIDFRLYKLQGCILEHFPLHKRRGAAVGIKLFAEHRWGLLFGFLTGNFR